MNSFTASKAKKSERVARFLTATLRCSAAAGHLEPVVQLSDKIPELSVVRRMCADVVDDFHHGLHDLVQLQ